VKPNLGLHARAIGDEDFEIPFPLPAGGSAAPGPGVASHDTGGAAIDHHELGLAGRNGHIVGALRPWKTDGQIGVGLALDTDR